MVAPLAGPTSNSPGGINDALPCVDGSADRTKAGMVNVPALADTRHSTRVPGVTPVTGPPDAVAVEPIAVMSTNPLGSPPVQVMVRGWVRSMQVDPVGKQPAVLPVTLDWLVHLNAAALDETSMLAAKAPTVAPGAVTV